MGYKYQPTDIDASIGIAALADFNGNLKQRKALVRLYRKELEGVDGLRLLQKGDSAD